MTKERLDAIKSLQVFGSETYELLQHIEQLNMLLVECTDTWDTMPSKIAIKIEKIAI